MLLMPRRHARRAAAFAMLRCHAAAICRMPYAIAAFTFCRHAAYGPRLMLIAFAAAA